MVPVNIITQVFAGVGALVHYLAFVWETLVFRRPGVHEGIFRIPTRDLPPILLWSFNVGVYNLLLGSGAVAGLIALHTGHEDAGRVLVVYTCAFMALAGVALFVSDRLALSRARGDGVIGAISQTVPPAIALIALAVS
jgi:putative membrane protein